LPGSDPLDLAASLSELANTHFSTLVTTTFPGRSTIVSSGFTARCTATSIRLSPMR
jgi:hypothetical protein